MSYQIRYEARVRGGRRWAAAGLCAGMLLWGAAGMAPVWRSIASGEGLYDALARFVGGMIRNAR